MGASLAPMLAAPAARPRRFNNDASQRREPISASRPATPNTALAGCRERYGVTMAPAAPPPSSTGTWPQAISSAEPRVKPLITGREKKLAMKPTRASPQASSTAPDINASCAASTPYSPEPTTANGARLDAVIREMIAIGPTDWVMLVPNTAYSRGGRMLAYRPATGGRPATMA